MMVTSPTPLMDSICCLIFLSAPSVPSRCERGAETAIRTTGAASVSNFCTMGCSAVTGRSLTIRSTLLRTSCAAMSGFFSSRKVMKTCDTPSTEVERSSSMALTVLTAPSILSVISVSISWGDAPGLTTVTVIVGRSIFGNRSTPNDRYEKSPTTVRLSMIIVANTGRRTQISASFCIVKKEVQGPRSLPYCRSLTQLVKIAGRYDFIGRDAIFDFHQIAFSLSQLNLPLLHAAILDDEHAADARFGPHRSRRNQHCRRRARLQDAHSCKLSRLQLTRRVLNRCFDG